MFILKSWMLSHPAHTFTHIDTQHRVEHTGSLSQGQNQNPVKKPQLSRTRQREHLSMNVTSSAVKVNRDPSLKVPPAASG